jgi:tRNA-dihydrouridine synthase C
MKDFLREDRPALVLAPMQDVTDLAFMRVVGRRGVPDWFVTEYFRVHGDSRLDRGILRSITENETGRPVFAQLIGREVEAMVRTARELEGYAVAGIDLNLGCPAPVVCRKDAGGGLLRNPAAVDGLIGALRDGVRGRFTVKTRVGFERAEEFEGLLEIFRKHGIDGLSVHGRTVADRYQTPVHEWAVARAVEVMDCPVIANGNVVDVETGVAYQARTGAAGLMVGRGAIRNPWIFGQLDGAFRGVEVFRPTFRDLWDYILELWEEVAREAEWFERFEELGHVQRMKRTLVYMAHGLDEEFEFRIRRVRTRAEFDEVCRECLDRGDELPVRPPVGSKLFCGFEELLGVNAEKLKS